MNKLYSIALCALVAPVLTLSAGSALAGEPAAQDTDLDQQSTQHEYPKKGEYQVDSKTALENLNKEDQAHKQNRGFLAAIPPQGLQASTLIGAEVTTSNDEEVGEVNELIIDSKGQVVAVVVAVGGFLGMGEKDVAIGWDDVSRTGDADDHELRIMLTRDQLSSAPEFDSEFESEVEEFGSEIESEFESETESDY